MASIIVYVYAALMALGGIGGYMMAGSVSSLIAGVLSGIILVVSARAMAQGKNWGLPVAMTVIVALMVFFGWRYFGSAERKFMPGGMNGLLSLITLIAVLFASRKRA